MTAWDRLEGTVRMVFWGQKRLSELPRNDAMAGTATPWGSFGTHWGPIEDGALGPETAFCIASQ